MNTLPPPSLSRNAPARHDTERREADELAASLEQLLGRAARIVRVRYEGARPDEWMVRVDGLDGLTFELDAVRRLVETARALSLGGRRVQLVALCDGSLYACTSRGVSAIDYTTGTLSIADASTAAVVVAALPS